MALERVAVLHVTQVQWAAAAAAMVGGFDIVLVAPTHRVAGADARRLMARSRERGTVLIVLQGVHGYRWPEPADIELTLNSPQWHGLGRGHGHIQSRTARIETTGRREMSRPRESIVILPDPMGQMAGRAATTIASEAGEAGADSISAAEVYNVATLYSTAVNA